MSRGTGHATSCLRLAPSAERRRTTSEVILNTTCVLLAANPRPNKIPGHLRAKPFSRFEQLKLWLRYRFLNTTRSSLAKSRLHALSQNRFRKKRSSRTKSP